MVKDSDNEPGAIPPTANSDGKTIYKSGSALVHTKYIYKIDEDLDGNLEPQEGSGLEESLGSRRNGLRSIKGTQLSPEKDGRDKSYTKVHL